MNLYPEAPHVIRKPAMRNAVIVQVDDIGRNFYSIECKDRSRLQELHELAAKMMWNEQCLADIFRIEEDPNLDDNVVEFRHHDGRVDRFTLNRAPER